MRIKRNISLAIFLAGFVGSTSLAQNAAPHFEVFAEGGGSILNNGSAQVNTICPAVCSPMGCTSCPAADIIGTFSKTGRLIAGGRLRFTRHDAIEASYSFSPNRLTFSQGNQSLGLGYGRVDLVSFNYVRYLWVRTPVQPFATIGVGTNHFGGSVVTGTTLFGSIGSDKGYQVAWNYGGGADIVLQRYLALRLELRDYVTGQPGIFTGTSHNIVPSAGIVFRFK